MPGTSKVSIEIDLTGVEASDAKLKAFVASLQAVSKAGAGAPSPQDTQKVVGHVNALSKFQNLLKGVGAEARGVTSSVAGAGEALRSFSSSAIGASGLAGGLGPLVGVASIGAAVAAVGTIVGMSLKMAYEFERASARAAASMQIGFGGSLADNSRRVQVAAYTGERYGYNVQEMVGAMEAFSKSSGADVAETTRAAPLLAQYARAYGLDPGRVGALVGTFEATSGRGDMASNASALFGGAGEAGRLGRRIEEFIGTSTSVLQTMLLNQTASTFDPARAAGFAATIAREGGIYSTQQGVQGVLGAGISLLGGGTQDPQKAAFLLRAGIPVNDILQGNVGNSGENIRRALRQVIADQGTLRSPSAQMELLGAGLSQEQLRYIEGLKHPLTDFNFNAAKAADAKARADEFAASPEGKVAAGLATLSNTMTADGRRLLDWGTKLLDDTHAIEHLTQAVKTLDTDLTGWIKTIGDWFGKNDGPLSPENKVMDPILEWVTNPVGSLAQLFRGKMPLDAGFNKQLLTHPNDLALYSVLLGDGMVPGDVSSVTGGVGIHVPGSAHFAGRAIDVGINDWSHEKALSFALRVLNNAHLQKLGSALWLIQNPDIMAAAAKAGTTLFEDNGTGPHLHLQVAPDYVQQMQRGHINYLEHLARAQHLTGNDFIKAIGEGLFAGDSAVGNPNVRGAGGETSGQYGDTFLRAYMALGGVKLSVPGYDILLTAKATADKASRNKPLAGTKPRKAHA